MALSLAALMARNEWGFSARISSQSSDNFRSNFVDVYSASLHKLPKFHFARN